VHAAVFSVVGIVLVTSLFSKAADRNSLLFALFGEELITEGPLPPFENGGGKGGVGGVEPGALEASLAADISIEDPEFELANALDGNALLSIASPQTSSTEVKRERMMAYRVRAGDTPSSIAAKFGISTYTVLQANGLREGDVIKPDDVLIILPVTGARHKVKRGETVAQLAERYNAKEEEIIAFNKLGRNATLRPGQILIIPDGYIPLEPRPSLSRLAKRPRQTPLPPARLPAAKRARGRGLVWPTITRHISQYFRWGHPALDIANRAYPPVYAAQAGRVEFAGWLGGYGKLIIINHGNGMKTYYAHLSRFYVKRGQKVSRGQAIARIGSTGRSTGPHLHFEVRVRGRPQNPLRFY
jgi:murein DD-endopeptidase MepM/ murein hydrolase activator NlpD